jgi:hypothetical protein
MQNRTACKKLSTQVAVRGKQLLVDNRQVRNFELMSARARTQKSVCVGAARFCGRFS